MLKGLLLQWLVVSVSVGLVALLLLALGKPLRRRYAAAGLCVAWLVLAARLLVPWNFSLPIALWQLPGQTGAVSDAYSGQFPAASPLPAAPSTDTGAGQASNPGQPPGLQQGKFPADGWQAAGIVWLAGMGIFLAVHFCTVARFARRARKARPVTDPAVLARYRAQCGSLHVKRPPLLCEAPFVAGPLLYGLFRPRILLPQNETVHDMALRHELVHYKHKHLWAKRLLLAVRTIHWFNPAVWLMVREADRTIELACDTATLRGQNGQCRDAYGDAILAALAAQSGRLPATTTALRGSAGFVRRRLEGLFKPAPGKKGISVVICGVLCAGLLAACASPATTSQQPPEGANGSQVNEQQASQGRQSSLPDASGTLDPETGLYWDTQEADGETQYLVANALQLAAINTNRTTLARSYKQTANIQLTGYWTPIGSSTTPFSGEYNGQGYEINGLVIEDSSMDNMGLFGCVENGVVANVVLREPSAADGTGADIPVVALMMGGEVKNKVYQSGVDDAMGAIEIVSASLEYYTEGDLSPYIMSIFRNNSNKTITDFEYGMLAYDAQGSPIEFNWWGVFAPDNTPAFLNETHHSDIQFEPGMEIGGNGGWSILESWDGGQDFGIAYVLVTIKTVTFEDGSVWANPAYGEWVETYESHAVQVAELAGYYPHTPAG